jgi:FdhD protein
MTQTASRPGATSRVRITHVGAGAPADRNDRVATEEPLEIRIKRTGEADIPLAITMRTPGNDFELAVGLLVSEGIVRRHEDVVSVRYCTEDEQLYNVVTVDLHRDVRVDRDHLARNLTMTSACGVCGKASIDAIRAGECPALSSGPVVPAAVVAGMPDTLRERQKIFDTTGGLHGAGLFDASGKLLELREDVGRHNAVDKVVGFLQMQQALPASGRVLVVSGRASFEIVQKAAMAGIPFVAAVGAPSSLAVQTAEELGLTLCGFVRAGAFNVYAGRARVAA